MDLDRPRTDWSRAPAAVLPPGTGALYLGEVRPFLNYASASPHASFLQAARGKGESATEKEGGSRLIYHYRALLIIVTSRLSRPRVELLWRWTFIKGLRLVVDVGVRRAPSLVLHRSHVLCTLLCVSILFFFLASAVSLGARLKSTWRSSIMICGRGPFRGKGEENASYFRCLEAAFAPGKCTSGVARAMSCRPFLLWPSVASTFSALCDVC